MHLSPSELEIIKRICQEYIPNTTLWAFGSRVHGKGFKPFSDLDLAIKSPTPISIRTLSALKHAFSESDLSFKVDIVLWDKIDDGFKQHIQANYEILYSS